ncbi:MAG TPA: hypothetical protein VM101_08970 [Flavitalea sp.]|nr:hypothetical protein [Flavitalea sp.]
MKTILLYTCAVILISCQKEVILPNQVKEQPHEVVIPEPQPEQEPNPEAEPDPIPDPPPGEISQTVYLRNLPLVFNSQNHYKLAKIYTENYDLWQKTPSWVKDDIHTFNDMGDGIIESPGAACPDKPFNSIAQQWSAYVDDEGVRLTWVDCDYQETSFILVKANAGVSFKAYYIKNDVKIYLEFRVVSTIK